MNRSELREMMMSALNKAFRIGQTYWQHADSDFPSRHKKADAVLARFKTLVDETLAALGEEPEPQYTAHAEAAESEALRARVAELEDVLRKVRTCASIDSSVMALVVESLNRKSLEQKAGEL